MDYLSDAQHYFSADNTTQTAPVNTRLKLERFARFPTGSTLDLAALNRK